MIFPPKLEDVAQFLARLAWHGNVRDVRLMNGARCDDECVDERREYLRDAQQRSRARRAKHG